LCHFSLSWENLNLGARRFRGKKPSPSCGTATKRHAVKTLECSTSKNGNKKEEK
jgi:hypothetical protein